MHKRVAHFDAPLHQCARHNSTHALDEECVVHIEESGLAHELTPVLPWRQKAEEEAEEVQPLACHVGDHENRCHALVRKAPRHRYGVLLCLNLHWHLPAARRLQHLVQHLHSVLHDVLGAHVDLCDYEEGRNAHCKCEMIVLARHADDALVGRHHEHAVVRKVSCHAEDCRLEVLGVASEVDEEQHLLRVLADLCPRGSTHRRVIHEVALPIEADDLTANVGCLSGLHLVAVLKDIQAG
mmetsp:Transcript_3496/g.12322  ORF Transcript_3496/g.12322 Transcript_3496/m.12322 type:complete len:239 (+) Transcript_3496:733-1449(+)